MYVFPFLLQTGPLEAEDELTDTEDNEEEDLGVMEDQRSVILHLISQLKLGMDLTKVCKGDSALLLPFSS